MHHNFFVFHFMLVCIIIQHGDGIMVRIDLGGCFRQKPQDAV